MSAQEAGRACAQRQNALQPRHTQALRGKNILTQDVLRVWYGHSSGANGQSDAVSANRQVVKGG